MSEGLSLKYFVLNPTSSDPKHAEASRVAILSYALTVEGVNPVFSRELFGWVEEISQGASSDTT